MSKTNPIFSDFPHMLLGGDYNPEQWIETPEIWDEDMKLMKEANANVLTVGIFSWAEIEPEENVFNFTFMDEIIEKIYANGGRVMLATPSAGRPHWLADKYPEVLMVNAKGVREHFRRRHNFCASSEAYRERVRIINEKISERYGNHPAVIGWHLSNEYGDGMRDGFCYCEKCAQKFREWLKDKYKDIDELNRAWWTRFWSHKYDSFDQIEPPYLEIGNQNFNAQRLDWKRFSSDNLLDFMKEEIKAVRRYSNKPVTTNGMCTYPGLNYAKFAKELDFFSQDIYPEWHNGTKNTAQMLGLACDYTRSLKNGKPFIVMESAPGAVCSGVNFRKVKSGQHQILEAIKYISYGADSTMYFQWRKGRGATEKFHGAIVDHYGKSDTRVFKTISEIGAILKKLDGVVGSEINSDVAITFDTENWWALGMLPPSTHDNGYLDTVSAYYNAFADKNIQTDVIGYDEDFSKYKLVILTAPYLMNQQLADKIKDYVNNGGVVVTTYLTAVTDMNDLCVLGGVPGYGLGEVFGLRVDELDCYKGLDSSKCNGVLYNNREYPLNHIAEIIVPDTAKAIGNYTKDFYAGTGALYVNNYGKGKAYYVGFMQPGEFQKKFAEELINNIGLKMPMAITVEDGVCVRKRESDTNNFYFIINETDDEKKITLPDEYKNVLNDETVKGIQILKPCGFLILTDK